MRYSYKPRISYKIPKSSIRFSKPPKLKMPPARVMREFDRWYKNATPEQRRNFNIFMMVSLLVGLLILLLIISSHNSTQIPNKTKSETGYLFGHIENITYNYKYNDKKTIVKFNQEIKGINVKAIIKVICDVINNIKSNKNIEYANYENIKIENENGYLIKGLQSNYAVVPNFINKKLVGFTFEEK